ncbi:MAG TPA: XamI family restriction endonuclease [Aggregatilineaceae bacterium]|nr:XamI family restriction endonuclease [Aggregatilineaceae bacterium]
MPVNANKPERWKSDTALSIDFYNKWFMHFAPETFRVARQEITVWVDQAIEHTANLVILSPTMLKQHPAVLKMLRMATAPPIARDRLSGLANVSRTLIETLENGKSPSAKAYGNLDDALARICDVIATLLDQDIFPWLAVSGQPTETDRLRAASIIADRLSGATADPIIRNAQERRQLATIQDFLEKRGYQKISMPQSLVLHEMRPDTFTFRHNVVVGTSHQIRIPIDALIWPHNLHHSRLPIFVEAKSAGDFTNTNKRRKEEAQKMTQLKLHYGEDLTYILFLNGYFDSGYLGYEAAEGIDWVWEHRIEDLLELGV